MTAARRVERVAEAIALSAPEHSRENPPVWPSDFSVGEVAAYRVQAFAAIAAYEAALAEDGLAIRPREPTQAMIVAWIDAYPPVGSELSNANNARADWIAMFDAGGG